MPSVSSNSVRTAPQQERAVQRLAGFLEAAEQLFAEVGYEATTMTAVAERSGAAIGTLYHYFPDKQSLALALVYQCSQEIQAHWQTLLDQAASLTHQQFAHRFIECILDYTQQHPAYLALCAAPIRLKRDPATRRALRTVIAAAFRAKNPKLTQDQAILAANVAIQITRGMTNVYAESPAKDKPEVAAEFKKALAAYLSTTL